MRDYIRIMLSMIELELRRLAHDRTELYIRAVQPLLWLLLFGPVLGSFKGIPTGGIPYTDYIMPGVLVQSTTSVAIFFGLLIIWEREGGILKKLFASPAPRLAVLLGRSMAAGTRALCQAVFIIPFAMLIGVSVLLNPIYILLALAVVFIASSGFAAMSILIASILRSRERFVGVGQVIILPMFFGSNALYPVSAMPQFLRVFASINPMTYMVDAIRGLLITGDVSGLAVDLVAILIFDIVIFSLASWGFKRVIE